MKITRSIAALACAAAVSLTQVIGAFAADDDTAPQQTDVQVEHEHSYKSEITKQATCAEEGEITYTCECGDSYTEPVAKTTSHKYGVGEVVTEAACGVEGKTVFTCKLCGESETTFNGYRVRRVRSGCHISIHHLRRVYLLILWIYSHFFYPL